MKKILPVIIVFALAIATFFYLQGPHHPKPENPNKVPLNQGKTDWTSYLGPNFDASCNIDIEPKQWGSGLKLLWHTNYLLSGDKKISTWSAPVIQGNRCVVMGRTNTEDFVYCLHADTGKLLWVQNYKTQHNDKIGLGARATPAIDKDKVYTLSKGGLLYCWNLLDGKVIWNKSLVDLGGAIPMWGFAGSPIIIEDKLIVNGGGKIKTCALNKLNGELIWSSGEGHVGYSTPLPVLSNIERSLIVFSGESLDHLNIDTGKHNWRYTWKNSATVNISLPVMYQNKFFISSSYGKGSAYIEIEKNKTELIPKLLWKSRKLQAHQNNPVLYQGHVFAFHGKSEKHKGKVLCINLDSSEVIWESDKLGMGCIIKCNGKFLVLNTEGDIFILEPSLEELKILATWKSAVPKVKKHAWVAPVIANHKLYLREQENLWCFQIP